MDTSNMMFTVSESKLTTIEGSGVRSGRISKDEMTYQIVGLAVCMCVCMCVYKFVCVCVCACVCLITIDVSAIT